MRFDPPLIEGVLIRRYKRFLADIRLADGTTVTVHCANSGSMKTCSEPGSAARISDSGNPGRKLRHTLEMVRSGRSWVGVHTGRTNGVVREGIEAGRVTELQGYSDIRNEVRYGTNSRIDLLLSRGNRLCYVEVKSVSMAEKGVGRFPDAITERGTKHLTELMEVHRQGHRAVMFFLVQRSDAKRFEPAWDIDPVYSQTLVEAHAAGVEILVYRARVTARSITMGEPLPFHLSASTLEALPGK